MDGYLLLLELRVKSLAVGLIAVLRTCECLLLFCSAAPHWFHRPALSQGVSNFAELTASSAVLWINSGICLNVAGNGQTPFVTEYPESPIPSWHVHCSSISSFPTALPRGDWEQLQSSAPARCVRLPGSAPLVDNPCLRLWGERLVICYCMPGVSTPENRTGVGIF